VRDRLQLANLLHEPDVGLTFSDGAIFLYTVLVFEVIGDQDGAGTYQGTAQTAEGL
jgi:hypothetical protein